MINHVQFPALGLEFTLNRVAFSLGGLDVYWYGIILALGLLAGMAFAFHYAVDFGIDSDRLVDVMVIGTVCGVACARIYYVAFAPFKYNSLWEMIDLRDGGIAIYGAVIGAFIIGLCENLIKSTEYTVFSDAFTFALLIVILVFKPTGLFGEKSTDKV